MMLVGLTGSIGMGKSTTAQMFRDAGIPVFCADDAVHLLYRGRAAPLIEAAFPGVVHDGVVNRDRLSELVVGKPDVLRRLEKIIHPLVREEEVAFLDEARRSGAPFALLDIPLLFETGGETRVDRIVVVTAPPDIQRERVLKRPGMTAEKFAGIMARQVPDAEKRARADFVIHTSRGMEAARAEVDAIIERLNQEPGDG
jgi:dephospho-CoA kinase